MKAPWINYQNWRPSWDRYRDMNYGTSKYRLNLSFWQELWQEPVFVPELVLIADLAMVKA